ncbi:hypothetical protein MCOR27_002549 [Pyricularia oryzae]|uniref:ATP-dependent RNA helicase n=2 Tax=Pyricularia TaxID=48558 RepID=A0ABQ8NZ25_PYRGI|nr:hypothetical protein MCOR01_010274 [Pyricularia oryzae]KAI6304133.1 hypothetical protein MCOR33_000880 [Pyricularia grisea]KAH9436384.1 hypothetical protein MCOR02_000055 [Pyricularia oryzae]KAI6262233.1 hypothetical protein MCOR19_001586 [Pyricularia oryzae]KAI6279854.1 hypothetical protein MCOR26_003982 [Pyricularia oryzae]
MTAASLSRLQQLTLPLLRSSTLATVNFAKVSSTKYQASRTFITFAPTMDSKSNGRPPRRNNRKRPANNGNATPDSENRRPRQRPFHNAASAQRNQSQDASAASAAPVTSAAAVIDSNSPRFADLASENLLDPVLLDTITQDLKFDRMSPVQAATIRHLIADRGDVLAQAKTGTGKTIAFLLPALQTLLRRPSSRGNDVSVLVISPTRELALQIAKEAEALLQRLPQYKVCTAIGGTNKDAEQRRILRGCQILIGTPGRLMDHLEEQSVAEMLQSVDTFVLDEADRLLDMGFMPQLKKIVAALPNRQKVPRQGMLFSATVAEHVAKVSSIALAPDYKFISTIPKGESNTHERVPQHLIEVPNFSDTMAALVGALRHELAESANQDEFKAIVFAPTAALVDFYAAVLEGLPNMPRILTLHSRMTQSKRTRVTEDYRKSNATVLVATDVVARGMDFPSVTNVFQVGLPMDKESYIHRLGRTARAGAEGRGTFIVSAAESYFPRKVMKDFTFIDQPADLSALGEIKEVAPKLELYGKAYQSWLGFYKVFTKPLGWDNEQLVREANKLALEGFGAPEVPPLNKSTVGKMGLKGVKGLVVVKDPPRENRSGGGRQKKGDSW